MRHVTQAAALAGDALRDGLRDQPHSATDRLLALATQVGATAALVLLLARTDEKKQVLAAVCAASYLSTLLAYATRLTEERAAWRVACPAGAPAAARLCQPRHRRLDRGLLDQPTVAARQGVGDRNATGGVAGAVAAVNCCSPPAPIRLLRLCPTPVSRMPLHCLTSRATSALTVACSSRRH
jgi:hypothetical protein